MANNNLNLYVVRWNNGRSHSVKRYAESAIKAIDRVLNQYVRWVPCCHICTCDAETRGVIYATAYYNDGNGCYNAVITATRILSDDLFGEEEQ